MSPRSTNKELSEYNVEATYYTADDLKEVKNSMVNYFVDHGINPRNIRKTASTYFESLAIAITQSKVLGEDIVPMKSSYLRNIFFYEGYTKFKRLSKSEQDNVGIAKNPRIMRALERFLELHSNTKKRDASEYNPVKWIKMPDWKPKLQKHNPQGEDHTRIFLDGRMFKQIRCKVVAKSTYYRFGFKLLDAKTDLVGEGLIKARNNDVLIHTGQSSQTDFSRKDLFVSLYVGLEKVIAGDKFTNIYPTKEGYECILYVDSEMSLHFIINNKPVVQFTISKKLLSRAYMFAWADHDEFDISVKDIFVEIQ